jgi:hypothetical protein
MQGVAGEGGGKVKSQFKLYELWNLFFVTLLLSMTDILLTPTFLPYYTFSIQTLLSQVQFYVLKFKEAILTRISCKVLVSVCWCSHVLTHHAFNVLIEWKMKKVWVIFSLSFFILFI